MGCSFIKYQVGVATKFRDVKGISVLYRFIQLMLVVGIGVLISWNGSWNDQEEGVSSVITNVEGVEDLVKSEDIRDAIDLVMPPQEKDAVFITTTFSITQQNQSTCPYHDQDGLNNCRNDKDCLPGMKTKNGIKTGKCDQSRHVCIIEGWCPNEDMSSDTTLVSKIHKIENFTISILNSLAFFKFQKFRTNYVFDKEGELCLYDPEKKNLCPIFPIKYILKKAQICYEDVRYMGAVIGIFIKWECYFNPKSGPCKIEYTFKHISKEPTGEYAGYRYKSARYDMAQNPLDRTKVTRYGLRFVIFVRSEGYKFDYVNLLSSIGSHLVFFVTLKMIYSSVVSFCCFSKVQKTIESLEEEESEPALKERKHDPFGPLKKTKLITRPA